MSANSFPYRVQGHWQFITQQWGALYVMRTWAYPWVMPQTIISGFAGAFLHLERNEIGICRGLFFTLRTVRGKNERTNAQAFYAVCSL